MDARDSARDNAMYEAENDQLIGKLIELERATSALRLVQTLVVLLERLIPLLEEIRAISRNSLAVIAMLKDNLLNVEAELQQRSCEVREQILARYHRALTGWREHNEVSLYSAALTSSDALAARIVDSLWEDMRGAGQQIFCQLSSHD